MVDQSMIPGRYEDAPLLMRGGLEEPPRSFCCFPSGTVRRSLSVFFSFSSVVVRERGVFFQETLLFFTLEKARTCAGFSVWSFFIGLKYLCYACEFCIRKGVRRSGSKSVLGEVSRRTASAPGR